MRMRLNDWLLAQPMVQAVDQTGTPLESSASASRTFIRAEMLDQWRAEKVLAQVIRDLKPTSASLAINSDFRPLPGENRRYWVLNFTYKDREFSIPAGDLFAEISDPYGWGSRDWERYRIGVNETKIVRGADGQPQEVYAGFLSFVTNDDDKPKVNGRTLEFQWNPDVIPPVSNERPLVETQIPVFSGDDQAAMVKETLRLTREIHKKVGA